MPELDPGQLSTLFAHRLVARHVPDFVGRITWEGDCLSVSTDRGYVARVSKPSSWSVGPGSTGLGEHIAGGVAAAAAAATLLAALERHVDPARGEVRARPDHLLMPLEAGPDSEWLGFRRTHRGWVGVVLVDEDASALFEALVARQSLMDLPPADAAALLQSFGIPAMSARQASRPVAPTVRRIPELPFVTQADRPIDALTGSCVADLGRLVAGPFAAQVLGGLGANVVRVRPPGNGGCREAVVEVDLRTDAGRQRCRDVVLGCDGIVENFGISAGARLQEMLADIRPKNWTAIRGYPSHSPRREWRLFGFLVEASFGVGAAPCSDIDAAVLAPRVPVWDRVTGTTAAASMLAALGRAGSPGSVDGPVTSNVSLVQNAADLLLSSRELCRAA